MNHERDARGGRLAHTRTLHRNPYASLEGAEIVVRRKQDRQQIAEKGNRALSGRQRPYEVVGPVERGQSPDQFMGHVLDAGGGSRRDRRQARRDREQVLDPVAHLAGQKLIPLLGLLAPGDVEEDAEHRPTQDIEIFALSPRGDPPDLAVDHDAKVSFVGAQDCAGRSEGGPDTITIRRVNVRGQLLEGHLFAPWHSPQRKAATVHGQQIGIDVPGPKSHAGGLYG